MYTTDFAYDRPIFLVPLSPSYPSSPVNIYSGQNLVYLRLIDHGHVGVYGGGGGDSSLSIQVQCNSTGPNHSGI